MIRDLLELRGDEIEELMEAEDWEGMLDAEAAMAEAELAAEMAIERHYENQGWEETLIQEEAEAAAGVVSFEDAMAAAMGRDTMDVRMARPELFGEIA